MKTTPWHSYLTPAAILLVAVLLVVSDWRGWFARNPVADGRKAMAAENYVQAIRDFARAQRACDHDIAARFELGAAYQGYGWHDEALKQYEATWKLAAENGTRAMHSAGRIWFHRGDLYKSAACFDRALTLTPDSPDIWYELGLVHRQAGRQDAARAAFQQALRLDPQNAMYQQAVENRTIR